MQSDDDSTSKPLTAATQLSPAFAGVIDVAVLTRLRKDYDDEDGSFVAGLVEAFVDESRVLLAALRGAPQDHMDVIAKAGHRMKSAAATVGAMHVVTLCRQLELAGRAGDAAKAAEITAAMPTAIVRARAALARLVAAGVKKPASA